MTINIPYLITAIGIKIPKNPDHQTKTNPESIENPRPVGKNPGVAPLAKLF